MKRKPKIIPFPQKPKPSIFDQPGGLELTVRQPWKDDPNPKKP